jgi:tRNA-specific 2-thiouridylase
MKGRSCVAVAMSGGVDSSVTAALMVEAGFDVIGLTLRMTDVGPHELEPTCGGLSAVASARAVADRLGIPHHVIDCGPAFRERVLAPAWADYAAGRTPNPCVQCNRVIKFGLMMDQALALGADTLATGHYARVGEGPDGLPALFRGLDRAKDQSYFLYRIPGNRLESVHLPLGGMTKPEVRALAARWGFENADRPDSQDACLALGDEPFPETLRRLFGAAAIPGSVVDEAGRTLGVHEGVHRLTIGQRKGVGLALGQRAWVLRIESDRAVVTCDPARLQSGRFRVRPATPFPGLVAGGPALTCEVQVRYRHAAVPCRVSRNEDAWDVVAATPIRAVTPGQSAVFYDGDRVLAGGVILESTPSEPAGAA